MMFALRLSQFSHPRRHSLTHSLLEGEAEGAVATVATVASQLLGGEGALGNDSLLIETDVNRPMPISSR